MPHHWPQFPITAMRNWRDNQHEWLSQFGWIKKMCFVFICSIFNPRVSISSFHIDSHSSLEQISSFLRLKPLGSLVKGFFDNYSAFWRCFALLEWFRSMCFRFNEIPCVTYRADAIPVHGLSALRPKWSPFIPYVFISSPPFKTRNSYQLSISRKFVIIIRII